MGCLLCAGILVAGARVFGIPKVVGRAVLREQMWLHACSMIGQPLSLFRVSLLRLARLCSNHGKLQIVVDNFLAFVASPTFHIGI